MEKMKMHSPNLTQENIHKLAELFPNCVTEVRKKNSSFNPHPSSLRLAVDFDLLRQELSESIVEGPQERYHLNWPGKREALLTANAPITKTLRPCREESVDFDTTKNLFIEGDNLDALKLLQETYLGKVKMIYIDPPYNTGKDFIYRDNFTETRDAYLHESGQHDADGNRLVANTESNGRFHSDWLSMIYPRLKLARNLLKDDGVIFISIDDEEEANVKKLCDEIFGEQNFQANISWEKRYTRSNNTVDFTTVIEHIIIYSKSSDFIVNLLPRSEETDARYSNPDNDVRGVWKGTSFLNPATPSQRPNLCYPITNPNTNQVTRPTTNAWRRSKEEFEKLAADNRLYWGKNGIQPVPAIKIFLSEVRGLTPINFWEHEYAGNTDKGTAELQKLIEFKAFNNPKPSKLIYRCLEHGVNKDDIILDYFAGSATTAHAVMQLNAEDGGNRRFVMVQLPETCDEKSEAFNAGYATIAEIGKERIRRACKKIKEENATTAPNLDIGFRVFKVDTSNIKDMYYSPDTVKQADLFDQIDNIKADRTPEDLLFQVLLDWGVELTLPIRKETFQLDKNGEFRIVNSENGSDVKNKKFHSSPFTIHSSYEVYFVDENALAACFDSAITEELVKKIAERKPLRAVFRNVGFGSDSVKINVEQIFKLISPRTEVKSI